MQAWDSSDGDDKERNPWCWCWSSLRCQKVGPSIRPKTNRMGKETTEHTITRNFSMMVCVLLLLSAFPFNLSPLLSFSLCFFSFSLSLSHSLSPIHWRQVLLEFPWSLSPGGGASLPRPGVVLSEGSAGPPEERRQPDVTADFWPLLFLLPGEPKVRLPAT